MSRGSYATNPGHGYNQNPGRGGTYHGNMQHTTIQALTLRHREFILQMLLVLYTL